MKKIIFQILIMSCVIILPGCGKENLPNTYIEGSDFQYMRQGSSDYVPEMQRGEEGYYFRNNNFIYYLDEKTDTLLPLCNKADCLHDRESDPERQEACNAYVDNEFGYSNCRGIAYCNGYLYCLSIDRRKDPLKETVTLYRLAADGSAKEQVFRWNDVGVEDWIVHRDTLFYLERTFAYPMENEEEADEELHDQFTIKSLKLTGGRKQPETIYVLDEENVFYLGCNWPVAYGNYFYIIISGVVPGEGDSLYPYQKTFIYDIEKGTFTELTYEGMTKDETILGVTFWQDRILFAPRVWDDTDIETSYLETGDIYIADLDGTNAEIFMEDVPMGYNIRSDGRYLYLSNGAMVTMADWGFWDYHEKKTLWVYDENLTLVDTLFLPPEMKDFGTPPIGDTERMYTIYKDDNGGWGVLRFDKSKIGSCNGAEIELTVIPYE